jgi:hypothetical protein
LRVVGKLPYQLKNQETVLGELHLCQEAVMHGLAKFALVVASLGVTTNLRAADRGQFNNVPDEIRAWFRGVTGANGVPCCDISDGHRTAYDMRDGVYWVPVDGQWLPVPENTVIRNAGNPIGDAVVWYVRYDDTVIIKCFVPASEV